MLLKLLFECLYILEIFHALSITADGYSALLSNILVKVLISSYIIWLFKYLLFPAGPKCCNMYLLFI